MVKVGDLVNNVHTSDYNYGMVLETNANILEELAMDGLDLEELGYDAGKCMATDPAGARVLWECGDIGLHYLDELEVLCDALSQVG
jgi:hypothetical protein